jgi:alkyl hydroperoxide reductase subunit AhpC
MPPQRTHRLILAEDDGSSRALTTHVVHRRSLEDMITQVQTAAPRLEADAFVRGERRRRISLEDYRGTWVVVALGVRRLDVLELASLEEAFAADGAVVVAATPDDWHEVAASFGSEPVRFPILTSVDETCRVTVVVDPGGVVRHVGLRRSAHETLATLEELLVPAAIAA